MQLQMYDDRMPPWFWERVIPEPNTGCWLWLGRIDSDGYGHYGRGVPGERNPLVHRVTLRILGKLICDLTVDHKCETKSCQNPDHFDQVTRAENTHRQATRSKSCEKGHPYTAESTSWKPQTRGGKLLRIRVCLICHAAYQRAWRRKNLV